MITCGTCIHWLDTDDDLGACTYLFAPRHTQIINADTQSCEWYCSHHALHAIEDAIAKANASEDASS